MDIDDSGGEGIPLVLLHARSGNRHMWEHQVPAFTAAGFRVIAYDRRPEGVASEDLHALVLERGLDRFHLLGTAAGGIAALDYALSHPERLRSLVIANSIFGVQDPEYLELSHRLRPATYFEQLPADFRELGPAYRATNPEGVARWNELAKASPKTTNAVQNRITFAALEAIRVPTLLLTGDADLYTPPPVLRRFAARFPNCESLVIPECGHSAFWEQPALFNAAVLTFLEKNRGRSPR